MSSCLNHCLIFRMIVDRRFFRVIDWNLDQFLSAHPTPNNQPHSACYFLHTTITVLPESHFCVPFLFSSFHDSLRINRNRGVEFLRWCSSVSSQPLLNDYDHPCRALPKMWAAVLSKCVVPTLFPEQMDAREHRLASGGPRQADSVSHESSAVE